MDVKKNSLIMASNGELIPYRDFKQKKLEQNIKQGQKDPFGIKAKNKPPGDLIDRKKGVFELKKLEQKYSRAVDDVNAAFKRKRAKDQLFMERLDRLDRRDYLRMKKKVGNVLSKAGKALPSVLSAATTLFAPSELGSADLENMERKKYGGSIGVKMAKGGFKKKTPIY
jgi:hypothetical protein|tara:strand:+ start:1025 stop:1531 length:507 start_codon:yes stop_codon:yes gene_type:complete